MTHTIDTKQDPFYEKTLDRFTSTLNTNAYVINRQTEGLTHEDSVKQLSFRGNCMNWVLGHILSSRGRMLELLGEESSLTAQENELYESGSQPITAAQDAVPFERLLADLAQTTAQIPALVTSTSSDRLLEIINEEKQSTRLDALLGLIWHETYHVGQFEFLRQAAGTDDKIF